MSKVVARSIKNILTSPCQVAHSLNWRKCSASILSVRVTKECMELAVASHPDAMEAILPLAYVPLKKQKRGNTQVLNADVVDELREIVEHWHVCGLVVSWPVEKAGRCGAACGRVLHALDQIVAQDGDLLSSSRLPVCLWDEMHYLPDEDMWGRAPILGVPSNKKVHVASREQYKDRTNATAADVLNDYCRTHWPELYTTSLPGGLESPPSSSKPSSSLDYGWMASVDNADHGYKTALL